MKSTNKFCGIIVLFMVIGLFFFAGCFEYHESELNSDSAKEFIRLLY